MAGREKKYHYIYRTTCNINSRFYIGLHSTDNLNDGYMGSGTNLRNSIRKYGKENHSVDVLEFLPDRTKLKLREREIINENTLGDSLCMNLIVGGGSTQELKLEHSQSSKDKISKKLSVPYSELYGEKEAELQKQKRSKAAKKAWANMDAEKKMLVFKKISENTKGIKKSPESARKSAESRTGIPRSEKTKKKISESLKGKMTGDKNPNYGKSRQMSDATKKKISDMNKGRKHTEETKRKIGLIRKGRNHTKETKKKIAESLSNRKIK